MPVLDTPLVDSALYRQLAASAPSSDAFPTGVLAIAAETVNYLCRFAAYHKEYTLHDEVHCRRVVELMAYVLGPNGVSSLNAAEAGLLILAAYFHDVGMVPTDQAAEAMRTTSEWKLHEEQWALEHPNYGEIRARLGAIDLTEAQRGQNEDRLAQLRSAMFTDFVRPRHAKFSAEFVLAQYKNDPRLAFAGRPLADLLACLCLSHVRDPESICPANGLELDQLVGTTAVNTQRLAYVLRLADVLDFDRDRTPDSLYRSISFSSPVSLVEWEKHRAVGGWRISPQRIVFDARYGHPAYERACREFLDWVDAELSAVARWSRTLPSAYSGIGLNLPERVDRAKIGPIADPLTGRLKYQFYDLEFSLSRDEIVKLLMTDKLYSNQSLFVRELLQNSLDALRHKTSLYRASGIEIADQAVWLEHVQDNAGFHIVSCSDNGVGMDADIVRSFLTRAGRSYYRSPQFEQERVRFREKQCDFDPCARFGIGFLSCFMFGDEITVWTRKDRGHGRELGEPLIVEIAGLSGIITVRAGAPDQQAGTTVTVKSRRADAILDSDFDDPVRLVRIVGAYAVATEFPIRARSTLAGKSSKIEVPTQTRALRHPLERADLSAVKCISRHFAKVDERLGGEIRYAYICDRQGLPTLKSDEAEWQVPLTTGSQEQREATLLRIVDGSVVSRPSGFDLGQLACDGILISGHKGRNEDNDYFVGGYSLNRGFGEVTFTIDARSTLKPDLTPARTPPNYTFDEPSSWGRLFNIAGKAFGNLLDELAAECRKTDAPDRFWALAEISKLHLNYVQCRTCREWLMFPFSLDGRVSWRDLKQIGTLRLKPAAAGLQIVATDGSKLSVPDSVSRWCRQGDHQAAVSEHILRLLLLLSFRIGRDDDGLSLSITPGEACQERLDINDHQLGERFESLTLARFLSSAPQVLCVAGSRLVNIEHPLVRTAVANAGIPWRDKSLAQRAREAFLWAVSQSGHPKGPTEGRAAANWARVGQLFRAVKWDDESLEMRPPFFSYDHHGALVESTYAEIAATGDPRS